MKQTQLVKALSKSLKKWEWIDSEVIRDNSKFPCALCLRYGPDCDGCPLHDDTTTCGSCCKEWVTVRNAVAKMCRRLRAEVENAKREG